MFKKKFKNFMFNLGKLFTFSFGFLGLFGLIALLGAWSIDNNGNLQSDNLCSSYIKDFWNIRINANLRPNTTYTISTNDTTRAQTPTIKIYNQEYTTLIQTIREGVYGEYLTLTHFTTDNNVNGEVLIRVGISVEQSDLTYVMLNEGSNAIPYEPYGTWYSQANYEILENDISQLNEEIGELEEQVSDLQSRYEDLEIDFQETYDDLQNLQTEYNDLQDNFNLVSKSNLIYWIINNSNAYMFNINPHNVNNSNYDINYFYNNRNQALFNKQISFSPLDNIYYLENFSNEINENNPFENDNPSKQYQVLFVLANPCNSTLVFNLFDGTYDFGITALYNNGMIQNFENEKVSNYYVHVPFDVENNNSIIAFKVNFYWEDYISIQLMINSDAQTIQTYYDRGYYKAYNEYNSLYLRTLDTLNTANSTIDALNNRINELNEQLDNTVGWKPFIFTMADTPFRVVSNILGFEVFGVNLYKVLVGLITTLAILWLIRKLRK